MRIFFFRKEWRKPLTPRCIVLILHSLTNPTEFFREVFCYPSEYKLFLLQRASLSVLCRVVLTQCESSIRKHIPRPVRPSGRAQGSPNLSRLNPFLHHSLPGRPRLATVRPLIVPLNLFLPVRKRHNCDFFSLWTTKENFHRGNRPDFCFSVVQRQFIHLLLPSMRRLPATRVPMAEGRRLHIRLHLRAVLQDHLHQSRRRRQLPVLREE